MIEVIAGEGGQDSKAFVTELTAVYLRYAERLGLAAELWSGEESHTVVHVTGKGVWDAFKWEPGNHVVQRVPPTERGGRRHTSLVSVLVLPLPPAAEEYHLPEKELDVKFQPKGGPGGQHRNKTASACRMVHRPTGLSVFIDGRDQHANRREAYRILSARVAEQRSQAARDGYDSTRRSQFSGGGRGEKVRTYNAIEGRVTDHRLGTRTTNLKELMKGRLELILSPPLPAAE